MKKLISGLYAAIFVTLLPGAGLATQALGQEPSGEELAQAHRCYACHHETEALIGPPYQAIAARHGAKKEVMVDVLAQKIILGGGGNWGVVPMVPNEHVSEEDAEAIARWILNQPPG